MISAALSIMFQHVLLQQTQGAASRHHLTMALMVLCKTAAAMTWIGHGASGIHQRAEQAHLEITQADQVPASACSAGTAIQCPFIELTSNTGCMRPGKSMHIYMTAIITGKGGNLSLGFAT